MPTNFKIYSNTYKDSVSLMRIAAEMEALPDIERATAIMATSNNLALLVEAGFTLEVSAAPNDLIIAATGNNEEAVTAALEFADNALQSMGREGSDNAGQERRLPQSLEMACVENPDTNLVLISCPGEYAAAEAMKALRLGLNVMMFSDNVSLEEEITLKNYADQHDLLMMGPDCGTAIIQGVPLGFANKVKPGPVGIVAASGTGLQQVACLLDQQEIGLSHAIGTGGRDLHSEIGGITMSKALQMLADDDATEVIVLISKPPNPKIAERIFDEASSTAKPVIINFLGSSAFTASPENNVYLADTLEMTAQVTANVVRGENFLPQQATYSTEITEVLSCGQKYIRGLYSGGTFSYEAQLLMQDEFDEVWSTTPIEKKFSLNDPLKSTGHTIIDLGDDYFTQGRPHPMIDQRSRRERLLQEAHDPECAVILFDVVLGYGAHDNPAQELVETIAEAQRIASADQRRLIFIGFLCGTNQDPQDLNTQAQRLSDAGVLLAGCNAEAVRMAINIIQPR